jgi:hypothetical protein
MPKQLRVVTLQIDKKGVKRQDYDFVEPDLLLKGDHYLLMVEVKSRGDSPRGYSYPPSQLLNYMRLVAECQDSGDTDLPRWFSHLIVAPSSGPVFFTNYNEWILDLADNEGRLRVDPKATVRLAGRVLKKSYQRTELLLTTIPIYYRSWHQLAAAYGGMVNDDCHDEYRVHWENIGKELEELACRAGLFASDASTPLESD